MPNSLLYWLQDVWYILLSLVCNTSCFSESGQEYEACHPEWRRRSCLTICFGIIAKEIVHFSLPNHFNLSGKLVKSNYCQNITLASQDIIQQRCLWTNDQTVVSKVQSKDLAKATAMPQWDPSCLVINVLWMLRRLTAFPPEKAMVGSGCFASRCPNYAVLFACCAWLTEEGSIDECVRSVPVRKNTGNAWAYDSGILRALMPHGVTVYVWKMWRLTLTASFGHSFNVQTFVQCGNIPNHSITTHTKCKISEPL